jgi:hypothetical protein
MHRNTASRVDLDRGGEIKDKHRDIESMLTILSGRSKDLSNGSSSDVTSCREFSGIGQQCLF